jgi:hypothetical protein
MRQSHAADDKLFVDYAGEGSGSDRPARPRTAARTVLRRSARRLELHYAQASRSRGLPIKQRSRVGYSAHTIDNVTCLRLSSQCTAAQSGSACLRWALLGPGAGEQPRFQERIGGLDRQRGQVRPAAANRRTAQRVLVFALLRALPRLGKAACRCGELVCAPRKTTPT